MSDAGQSQGSSCPSHPVYVQSPSQISPAASFLDTIPSCSQFGALQDRPGRISFPAPSFHTHSLPSALADITNLTVATVTNRLAPLQLDHRICTGTMAPERSILAASIVHSHRNVTSETNRPSSSRDTPSVSGGMLRSAPITAPCHVHSRDATIGRRERLSLPLAIRQLPSRLPRPSLPTLRPSTASCLTPLSVFPVSNASTAMTQDTACLPPESAHTGKSIKKPTSASTKARLSAPGRISQLPLGGRNTRLAGRPMAPLASISPAHQV